MQSPHLVSRVAGIGASIVYCRASQTEHINSRVRGGASSSLVQAKTKTVKRTLNPTFAFEEEIAIWSPFSIVTLRAVDKDMLTKDDPIGFVDFCVADLHPNGEEVRGQLELRKMEHFEGTAKRRFLKHRRRRDDTYDEDELQQSPEAERDFDDVEDDGTLSFAALMRKKGLSRSMSKAAETMVKAAEMAEKVKPTFVKTLQTSVANVKPPRPAMCCGGLNGEKDETSGFLHWRKKRLNAGEIDISMRLETIMQPSYPDHEVPKHELLYTAVFEPERTPVSPVAVARVTMRSRVYR